MKKQVAVLLSILTLAAMFSACGKSQKQDPAALMDEGVGLLQGHEYARALADFDKAVAADPNDAKAHFFRGNALAGLGRKVEAIEEFNKSSWLAPSIPQPYFNKGNALVVLGRDEDALAAFDMAIQVDPAYERAYSNKGLILMRLGRSAEAKAALDKAKAIAGPGYVPPALPAPAK